MSGYLEKRRQRMQRIGAEDQARRCTFCRRALPHVGVLLMLTPAGESLKYCNENCRQDHIDALQTMEARR